MKPINQKANIIPRLHCLLFDHVFEETRAVTLHVKEYECKYCKKQATTNGNGRLTELTPAFREINGILERVYKHRTMRKSMLKVAKQDLKITG
ncbi:hypothetical protein ACFSQP_05515 [Bizionia sediminis]|uniref:Transposase n=1 Tax=Bizionia sediminis TaxID=1737064 RepID=A0ABW5KRL6_9FLAO